MLQFSRYYLALVCFDTRGYQVSAMHSPSAQVAHSEETKENLEKQTKQKVANDLGAATSSNALDESILDDQSIFDKTTVPFSVVEALRDPRLGSQDNPFRKMMNGYHPDVGSRAIFDFINPRRGQMAAESFVFDQKSLRKGALAPARSANTNTAGTNTGTETLPWNRFGLDGFGIASSWIGEVAKVFGYKRENRNGCLGTRFASLNLRSIDGVDVSELDSAAARSHFISRMNRREDKYTISKTQFPLDVSHIFDMIEQKRWSVSSHQLYYTKKWTEHHEDGFPQDVIVSEGARMFAVILDIPEGPEHDPFEVTVGTDDNASLQKISGKFRLDFYVPYFQTDAGERAAARVAVDPRFHASTWYLHPHTNLVNWEFAIQNHWDYERSDALGYLDHIILEFRDAGPNLRVELTSVTDVVFERNAASKLFDEFWHARFTSSKCSETGRWIDGPSVVRDSETSKIQIVLTLSDAAQLVDLASAAGSVQENDIHEFAYKTIQIFDAIVEEKFP